MHFSQCILFIFTFLFLFLLSSPLLSFLIFFLTILHFIMSITKKDLSKSSLKLISQECSCRSPYLLQGALTGVEVLQGIYAFGFMWRFPERRPINCIRTSKSTGPKKLKNYYYCVICFFPATSRKCWGIRLLGSVILVYNKSCLWWMLLSISTVTMIDIWIKSLELS